MDLFKKFQELNIQYQIQEHEAIFSEKDAEHIKITLDGIDVKNLFVKDKKGNFALITIGLHKRADLKQIALLLGFKRLTFCSADELKIYLDITPGSVSPLCIWADTEKKIRMLLDDELEGHNVLVHPLRNTATVAISFNDLTKFIEDTGHKYETFHVHDDSGEIN